MAFYPFASLTSLPVIQVGPSGDTTGVTDAANLTAAAAAVPASGGIVRMSPTAPWYIKCGSLIINRSGLYIDAPGCYIFGEGTGDVIRMYDSTNISARTVYGGGITGQPVIDGTSTGAGSAGLHLGDISWATVQVMAINFTGTGSIGIHFDNANYWTEKLHGWVRADNCTACVVFDVTGALTSTNSFGYQSLDVWVNGQPAQDGVVVQNGALLYHGRTSIRGNFTSSTSAMTTAGLRVTGSVPAGHPGAGSASAIQGHELSYQAELNGSGSNGPYTIFFDTVSGCTILNCRGILDFSIGGQAFTGSNATAGASFVYDGVLLGDTNLNPAATHFSELGGALLTAGPKLYGSSFMSGASGNVYTGYGDFFAATLSANVTIALSNSPQGSVTVAGPQRKTIAITQAAAGGPYTVTWPVNGSPTTASPTVVWPGGAAPVMPATASAIMIVDLETADGVTWYGVPRTVQVLPDAEQFTCLTAIHTLAANTNPQAIFNATTNGAVTLGASVTYYFESEFDLTSLSGSAHTLSLGFGGTAGVSTIKYKVDSNTGAAGTLAAWNTAVVTTASATAFTASVTTTTAQATVKGVVRTTPTGGTFIPQLTQGTNGAAAVVSVNSWFRIWAAGAATVASVGDWS